MWFIASFLFTFQVCTTRFNNKNKFFGHFCLSCGKGGLSSLVSGAAVAFSCYCSAMLLWLWWGQGLLPWVLFPVREPARLLWVKFISAENQVL